MKKFASEEERKEYVRVQNEKQKENHRRWRLENRERLLAEKKLYYQTHKERTLEKMKAYRNEHKEEKSAYLKSYFSTKLGLATRRLNGYRKEDVKYGRETTITREWIVDHIYSSSCVYCGEADWHKLGCDRKVNSSGHTPENCIPACRRCNEKRGKKEFLQYIGSLWAGKAKPPHRSAGDSG